MYYQICEYKGKKEMDNIEHHNITKICLLVQSVRLQRPVDKLVLYKVLSLFYLILKNTASEPSILLNFDRYL